MKLLIYLAVATSVLFSNGAWSDSSYEKMLRAVEDGETAEVKRLLSRGMDPNTTDPKGMSVLMIAARKGEAEIVALLIAKRANVGQQSRAGDTALLMACLNGNIAVIRSLLDAGGELNPKKGWTPLQYAAFSGHADAVDLLLKRGAEKDAVAPNGYTPLMLAARNGKFEAAKALLYADPDVNFRTPGGDTALRIARKRDMRELVELLKQSGAVE